MSAAVEERPDPDGGLGGAGVALFEQPLQALEERKEFVEIHTHAPLQDLGRTLAEHGKPIEDRFEFRGDNGESLAAVRHAAGGAAGQLQPAGRRLQIDRADIPGHALECVGQTLPGRGVGLGLLQPGDQIRLMLGELPQLLHVKRSLAGDAGQPGAGVDAG